MESNPSPTGAAPALMAIGGAIHLRPTSGGHSLLLQEFWQRAGGEQAQIVILPTASSRPEAGQEYVQAFHALGLHRPAVVLPVWERADALRPELADQARQASGIFFAGGNQVRLSAAIGGTPLEAALLESYHRGAIVAGTSAGAAILSAVMLAYGKSGATPRQGMAQFVPGLGFTDRAIFDQHFRQRDRLGRLLYVVANHPGVLGVGVDENTAALLLGDHLYVLGQHAVTIVDGRSMTASDVADVPAGRPVAASGALIHVLTHGCTFDLNARRADILKKILPVD